MKRENGCESFDKLAVRFYNIIESISQRKCKRHLNIMENIFNSDTLRHIAD